MRSFLIPLGFGYFFQLPVQGFDFFYIKCSHCYYLLCIFCNDFSECFVEFVVGGGMIFFRRRGQFYLFLACVEFTTFNMNTSHSSPPNKSSKAVLSSTSYVLTGGSGCATSSALGGSSPWGSTIPP